MIAVGLAVASTAASKTPEPRPPRADPSTILVKFKNPAMGADRVRARGDRSTGVTPNAVHIVKLAQGRSAAEGLRVYRATPGVLYAEHNLLRSVDLVAPNDSSFSSQWALSSIHAKEGWSVFPNAYGLGLGPKVAVVDTGVDATHPDLATNVDVLNGARCTSGTCVSNPALDDHGHGTHVAGVAGALTNNGQGIAGVAFSSPIIPIKALAANGQGSDASISSGILWASSRGARVINLSVGGSGFSQTLCDAVTTARAAGAVVVAAAGNDGSDQPVYPAACPGAVGVAATAADGSSPNWSNWGRDNVFLSAPGASILSTYWTPGGPTYANLSGTSMATPHVAALAALVLGQTPSRTPANVEQMLALSAEKIGADLYPPHAYGPDPNGICACTWHPFYGYGEIDVATALSLFAPPTIAGSDQPVGSVGATVTLTGSNFTAVSSVTLGLKPAPFVIDSPTQVRATIPSGVAYGRWRATNPNGTAVSPLVFTVAAPTIHGLSSTSGPVGTSVTISGSGFFDVTSVSLGLVEAPFVMNSPTTITAWVPQGISYGRWRVSSPNWTAAHPVVFTATWGIGQPFLFSPAVAPVGGAVTLVGRGLGTASQVSLGSVPTNFVVDSHKQITATVPPGIAYGHWSVTTGGSTLVSELVASVSSPIITGFSSVSGPTGSTVSITGSGFDDVISVSLGGAGASFTLNSATQITATVPPGVDHGRWRVASTHWTAEHPIVFTVTS